jgi:hypothetical protein
MWVESRESNYLTKAIDFPKEVSDSGSGALLKLRERERREESRLASLWLVLFRLGSQMASFGLDSSILLALKLILEWGFTFSIGYSGVSFQLPCKLKKDCKFVVLISKQRIWYSMRSLNDPLCLTKHFLRRNIVS